MTEPVTAVCSAKDNYINRHEKRLLRTSAGAFHYLFSVESTLHKPLAVSDRMHSRFRS